MGCDDGNYCTDDSCDPGGGCVFVDNSRGCDDGNPCTIDRCNPNTGACEYAPVSCDDGNACTLDRCDPAAGGCVYVPVNCDDQDPCTIDGCDPAGGAGCLTPDNGQGTVELPPALRSGALVAAPAVGRVAPGLLAWLYPSARRDGLGDRRLIFDHRDRAQDPVSGQETHPLDDLCAQPCGAGGERVGGSAAPV